MLAPLFQPLLLFLHIYTPSLHPISSTTSPPPPPAPPPPPSLTSSPKLQQPKQDPLLFPFLYTLQEPKEDLPLYFFFFFFLSLSLSLSLSLCISKMAPAESLHQASRTVCVMDASGRLGASLVEELLQRGYTVHAAVQNHRKLKILKGFSTESEKVRVFRSDPFDYRSIMEAIKGCSGLFYAFEPPVEQSSYDELMAEVEVRAAHNVLEACAQTESIEKVVFTSSVTAVIWRENRSSGPDLDERNWSDTTFCRNFKLWHGLSKTLAEKTAWALAMDRGVNMVSINAGLLTGPELSISNPYLKGAPEMYQDGVFVTVDVNFLVDAHICVFESSSTYGRYLCFDHVINRPEDALKLSHMLTPVSSSPSPPPSCDDLRIFEQRIQNKKLSKLMVNFGCGVQIEE